MARMRRTPLLVLLAAGALAACGEEEPALDSGIEPPVVDAGEEDAGEQQLEKDAGQLADAGESEDASQPADAGEIPPPPPSFIGSPCAVDTDCTYEGGICLTDGFPAGMCSLPCDRLCPDLDGFPTTFCIATDRLPSSGGITAPGACVSRCDFGGFEEGGCREEYGCVDAQRVNEPATIVPACIPGEETSTGDCLAQLALLGVDFETTSIPDQSPSGYPNLTCHVEQPVIVHPPINGIDVRYYDGSATPNLRAACTMAVALAKTVADVAARGVTVVRHIGTVNCRVIAGTDRLSRHASGDAIDLYGFEFADGSLYTFVDHWEHETTMPTSPEAIFLYESAYRWHDMRFWTILLTPNYNAAHDNHVHADLTPGSDFIGLLPLDDFGYIGPAPYAD